MRKSLETPANTRFERAIQRMDAENAQDPNQELIEGQPLPRELAYAQWVTEWILKLQPDASEILRLAARGAHLRRWSIARDSYPSTRAGYLRWRAELKQFHANAVGEILRAAEYDEETVAAVQALISKSCFPKNPESRILEDALCLVFLEHQFADLASRSSDDKMVNALKKTWEKMTAKGREAALSLSYGAREKALLQAALPN